MRWSRRHEVSSSASTTSSPRGENSIASSSSAGANGTSSGMRRRNSGGSGAKKILPDFLVGSYQEAVRKAKKEIKVLMIVLTCEEHEDDEEFKKYVL